MCISVMFVMDYMRAGEPQPPPPPPHFNNCVYVMLVCLFTYNAMAVATCTVSIPPLLPTEVVGCVVSLKVAFMSS